jgi:hypothetical protein
MATFAEEENMQWVRDRVEAAGWTEDIEALVMNAIKETM